MDRQSVTVDNPQAIIDELTYHSYHFNRLNAPHITPREWATIYQNAKAMEQRLRQETNSLLTRSIRHASIL